jgi:hypothetical protein
MGDRLANWSMMDCKGHLEQSTHRVKVPTCGPNSLPMWYRWWRTYKRVGMRGHGEEQYGLDHRLGPIPRKCGWASYSDVQQGFDLLWVQVTMSAECKIASVYSLFRKGATNTAGKEPIEALVNLWRRTGIVFRIKAISWRNVYENLYCQITIWSNYIDSA